MKKLNLNKFSEHQISEKEMQEVKGGTNFCQWYVGYADSKGIEPNPDYIAVADQMDAIAAQYGTGIALLYFVQWAVTN